jgi:hypothetical protein
VSLIVCDSVNIDALFDADTLHRKGECPWTFFAYPTDSRGLPPDEDAKRLLAELQHRALPVAIWINGIGNNTTYFACRHEDRLRVLDTVTELQTQGMLESNFLAQRCEYLFSLVKPST